MKVIIVDKALQFDECEEENNLNESHISKLRAQVLETVHEAWSFVTKELVIKSFKSCGISNELDGLKIYF